MPEVRRQHSFWSIRPRRAISRLFVLALVLWCGITAWFWKQERAQSLSPEQQQIRGWLEEMRRMNATARRSPQLDPRQGREKRR